MSNVSWVILAAHHISQTNAISFHAHYTYALCTLESSFCDGVCNMICDILLSIFVIRGVLLCMYVCAVCSWQKMTSVCFCKNCCFQFGFTKLTTVSVFQFFPLQFLRCVVYRNVCSLSTECIPVYWIGATVGQNWKDRDAAWRKITSTVDHIMLEDKLWMRHEKPFPNRWSLFLKTELSKPSFWFLNFDNQFVFSKPISNIFIGFRTPLFLVYIDSWMFSFFVFSVCRWFSYHVIKYDFQIKMYFPSDSKFFLNFWIIHRSHIAIHLVLVGVTLFKKPSVSNQIGVKYGRIILWANMHRLMESAF